MAVEKAVCLFILVIIVTNILYVKKVSSEECFNSPMDIVLLLDSSEGSQVTTFDQEKLFASALINKLWDGRNRFGLVTFGSVAFPQINLDLYTSTDEIDMAIQYLWATTGKADIGGAIKYSLDNSFSSDVGGRVVAPDVLILVTPLDIRNETAVKLVADELEQSDTELYVIVASSTIDTFWYKKFVPLDHIIKVNNGNELMGQVNTIQQTLCQGRGVLRQWTSWSTCASSCGAGLQRRTRTCEKRHQDDLDCVGELFEDKRCYNNPCTAPIDGSWSTWDTWSGCSKTCGNGTKSRVRTCTAPFPENGGEQCHGVGKETRSCSTWSCPDCNRSCPPGSKLSKECDVCECSNIVLYGNVKAEKLGPLGEAGIYFKSRMYSPLATTDTSGYFRLDGICVLNEVIVATKEEFSEETVTAEIVNTTHWRINATLNHLIAPVFGLHPEDKSRLVGQNVALCCQAVGEPEPTEYTWFHGLRPLDSRGKNGTLFINNIKSSDSGVYYCSTETDSGSAISKEATLTVIDSPTDSCSAPESYYEELPVGCHVDGDPSNNTSIDIKACGKGSCVSRELHDNGTCAEWWGHYCCDPHDFDWVTVNCQGFSYQTRRVKTCRCISCFKKTVITGKAYGRLENGTELPLKLGTVMANGKEVARTNMAGIFTFEIPNTVTKLVLDFEDDIFKKFAESTKVVRVTQGLSTALKIALALRPKPVDFHSNDGLQLEVGSENGKAAAGRIHVKDNSLVTETGEPYTGEAKAQIHYMDPRSLDDFEAASGEFSYNVDGEAIPLETFGVFSTTFEDNTGKRLINTKPMKFEIDPTVYNISADSDGHPNVDLWSFDSNSGNWKFMNKMQFETSAGRRRLLAQMIVGESMTSVNVPTINLFDPVYTTKPVVTYRQIRITNCDRPAVYRLQATYRTITVRAPDKLKRGACAISVSVFKTLSGLDRDSGGTQITAVTQSASGNTYLGVDKQPTDANGHVCLNIFCDSIVYLSAENKQSTQPLIAFPRHDIPSGYKASNIKNGTQVQLTSTNWEDVPTPSGLRYSPVYYYEDINRCKNNYRNDFTFKFAESQTGAPKSNFKYDNVYDNKLSWYPNPPKDLTRTTCFLKAFIKTKGDYDLRFIAISRQTDKNGEQYGTYNVGPLSEPTMSTPDERAACIEFRCAGLVNDGGTISTDVDTFLQVKLNPPKPNCSVRATASGLNIVPESGGTGFTFHAKAGNNYGPKYGVYIGTRNRATMERFCSQGKDTGTIDIGMNPALNAAIEYECS